MGKKKSDALNFDFDFDLDFDFDIFGNENSETEYKEVELCGLVKKLTAKHRVMMDVTAEAKQLEQIIQAPPTHDQCYKMLSVRGGFSTLSIIKYVADLEPIEEMYVNTFRIGLKHFDELDKLHSQRRLKMAHFITSSLQRDTDRTYNYFGEISKKCKKNKWELKVLDNHSKVILLKTKKNWHVIETSSNLNENPKMEQFNWENDEELYKWYEALFIELFKIDTDTY